MSQPASTACPSWQCTQEASASVLSVTTHVAVEDNDEIPLLQADLIQVSQAFVAYCVLRALSHISGLLLDSLQLHGGFSVLGSPELDSVLQECPWKWCKENNHVPQPAGYILQMQSRTQAASSSTMMHH